MGISDEVNENPASKHGICSNFTAVKFLRRGLGSGAEGHLIEAGEGAWPECLPKDRAIHSSVSPES